MDQAQRPTPIGLDQLDARYARPRKFPEQAFLESARVPLQRGRSLTTPPARGERKTSEGDEFLVDELVHERRVVMQPTQAEEILAAALGMAPQLEPELVRIDAAGSLRGRAAGRFGGRVAVGRIELC